MDKLIEFLWSAISSGVVGNATYDMIKKTLGNGFMRLASLANDKKRSEFDAAILAIIDTNNSISEELMKIFNDNRDKIRNLEVINQHISGRGNILQAGIMNTFSTNIYNNFEHDRDDNLDISVLSADALELTHPTNIEFTEPVIVISARNIGRHAVCVNEIIVQYYDGTIGHCMKFNSTNIDIGQTSNWFIPNGHSIIVSTGEVIHNMGVGKILKIDRDLIESVSIKTSSGKLFKVDRAGWMGAL